MEELLNRLDDILLTWDGNDLTVRLALVPVILLILAVILNWGILRFVLRPYFDRSEAGELQRRKVRSLLAGLLYFLALFIAVEVFIIEWQIDQEVNIWVRILKVIFASGAIIYGMRFLLWLINDVILKRYFSNKDIDTGRQYTITRLIMYVGFTFAIFSVMQVAGFPPSFLFGGGAALLVGIGLGLQQTFNDLFSGIVMLVEGTVEVGDIVKVDGFVAKMKKIGIRVSKVETRDNSVLLIPNSKLVVENVHNWSNDVKPTRFQVPVGVSYASDVRLVEKLLLQAAADHPRILEKPRPIVQFIDFGNSSLDFLLHFYSFHRYDIEFVKSDIRFRIVDLFREHNVEIPFPQRDLWLRNPEDLNSNERKKAD